MMVDLYKKIRVHARMPGTSPTRRSDIVLNVHDMRDVPDNFTLFEVKFRVLGFGLRKKGSTKWRENETENDCDGR